MDIYGFIMISCCFAFMNTRNPRVALFIAAVFSTCLALSLYFGGFSTIENEWLKIFGALLAFLLWSANIIRYFLHVISSSVDENTNLPKA